MAWKELFSVDEIKPDERKVVSIDEKEILIIRTVHNIFALEARCPHLNLSLKGGRVSEDDILTCPYHHSQFDLHTGAVKAWSTWPPGIGKAIGKISRERPLVTYDVKVEKGSLFVNI